ncbi:hypothetical protein ACLB2K_040350 [Fragaria x ananassa]
MKDVLGKAWLPWHVWNSYSSSINNFVPPKDCRKYLPVVVHEFLMVIGSPVSGLTQSNYKELNVLHEKYKNKGFEILAFPCNQFGGQEPGNNEEIQEVACTRLKDEFPIFDKIEVNGKNEAPLYKFLKLEKGGLFGNGIKWNFTKFLVNKEGKVVERYAPVTAPLKIELTYVLLSVPKDIQNLLESS